MACAGRSMEPSVRRIRSRQTSIRAPPPSLTTVLLRVSLLDWLVWAWATTGSITSICATSARALVLPGTYLGTARPLYVLATRWSTTWPTLRPSAPPIPSTGREREPLRTRTWASFHLLSTGGRRPQTLRQTMSFSSLSQQTRTPATTGLTLGPPTGSASGRSREADLLARVLPTRLSDAFPCTVQIPRRRRRLTFSESFRI